MCITFVQCWTNVLCLLGRHKKMAILTLKQTGEWCSRPGQDDQNQRGSGPGDDVETRKPMARGCCSSLISAESWRSAVPEPVPALFMSSGDCLMWLGWLWSPGSGSSPPWPISGIIPLNMSMRSDPRPRSLGKPTKSSSRFSLKKSSTSSSCGLTGPAAAAACNGKNDHC